MYVLLQYNFQSSFHRVTKQKALPEQGPIAREDDKLIIEFMPDADSTITAADSEIRLPVTVYPAR